MQDYRTCSSDRLEAVTVEAVPAHERKPDKTGEHVRRACTTRSLVRQARGRSVTQPAPLTGRNRTRKKQSMTSTKEPNFSARPPGQRQGTCTGFANLSDRPFEQMSILPPHSLSDRPFEQMSILPHHSLRRFGIDRPFRLVGQTDCQTHTQPRGSGR